MSYLLQEIEQIQHLPIPKRNQDECFQLAKHLLSQMTLQEKIGQLYQLAPSNASIEGIKWSEDNDDKKLIASGQVGSILSVYGCENVYKLQKIAVEESRLGIPLLFGFDVIHGCSTGFPINLAMACSFDPDLVYKVATAMAKEASHLGISMIYSPMVDLARDPRWGRVMESNGEDPFLNQLLAKSYVNGYQQNNLTSYDTVAACCKHFAAYGAPIGGREYNTVDMSDRELRQYYLTGYKACAEANVAAFMTSFNIVNGVPATANSYLIKDILREEWSYKGIVLSDYTSSFEMIAHKTAKNDLDVAKQSILAGLDHEMVSTSYIKHLEYLVNDKHISVELINEACLRILQLKYQLGLFDNPYKNVWADYKSYQLQDATRSLAREISTKSIVLLKNERILPVKNSGFKIAVIGPFADNNEVVGAWGGLVHNDSCVTLLDALISRYGENNIVFAAGCAVLDNDKSGFNKALDIAQSADIIILAVGEEQSMTGEAKSRAYLSIPGVQNELAVLLKTLNKPMVSVVFSGRPLELSWYHDNSSAVIMAWFLGSESGNALVDILSGDVNPSGKLAMSFPYTVGQVPIYYNQYATGRPSISGKYEEYRSCYIDVPNYPLYQFGYGLSYSQFEYSDLKLSTDRLIGIDELSVEVTVSNLSEVDGDEVVQLYIECKYFSVVRPVRELKAIKKITVLANHSHIVKFQLSRNDLTYYDINMELNAENTLYTIYVGGDSSAKLAKSFYYQEK